MMGSGIIWRMAWKHLRRQWRQTLLTIAAGAIGALLIAVSFVNYDSLKFSGEQWIETRLGPISWKLTRVTQGLLGFTPQEVESLSRYAEEHSPDYRLLPYVSAETTLQFQPADGEHSRQEAALKSVLALGFPMETAARFDPDRADLWGQGIGDDEFIINEETASLLGVDAGDAVLLVSGDAEKLLRVREIVPEQGLAGYRESGAFSGTVIASEATVRELAGLEGGVYPAIWSGTTNPHLSDYAIFMPAEHEYRVQYLKADFRTKAERLHFTLMISFISVVAIASSMLFMRQVLIMIAESRREIYGVLRAIGLSARQVSGMFLAEALLLSLLSALVGTVAGIGAGLWLVDLFYGRYSEELKRMTGDHIPVYPHISVMGAVALFLVVFAFLAVIALATAQKAGKTGIVEAIRGEAGLGGAIRKRSAWIKWFWIGLGIFAAAAHFGMAFLYPPEINDNFFLIILLWLAACCVVLLAVIAVLGKLVRPLGRLLAFVRIPRVSLLLAVKYPRSRFGRTYTIALLFALIMMIVSFTVTITSLITAIGDADRTAQTVLGNGGYAAYQTEAEREKIINAAAADPAIADNLSGIMVSEPFMLDMSPDGLAQAAVPVTKELLERRLPPLAERAPHFGSDKEAWEKVLNDPQAILMPYHYKTRDDVAYPNLRAGDTAVFRIYKNGLRAAGEEKTIVAEKTFTVAGFVQNEASAPIDFYGTTYINAGMAEELKPYGFKWPNQTNLGFVLFDFEYRDVQFAQRLEERFAINGVLGFTVPYLDSIGEQMVNQQLGSGFVGCAVFSGLISLMGLAVVQYRSVRERGKQLAMMRCIGISGKQIYWMFMLEGIAISAAGLLTGWGVGFSGARLFTEAVRRDIPETLAVAYPYEIVLPVLGGLLLMSLLLNMAPARAALKLKAADALRLNHE